MSRIERRAFLTGALCGSVALAGAARMGEARAQGTPAPAGWPNRPVRFIVPLAPGGGLDFIARATGEFISRGLGQQVVVENRTGAGGTIGIDATIKSPPDGYSVLLTNDNVASAPHVMKLPAEFNKDLDPVILLARQPQAFALHPSLGIKSLEELIRLTKDQPGQSIATSGVGTNQHVLMEWFARTAGIRFAHVPYRGAGQAINDLIAGHVKIACLGPTALMPHYTAGSLRLVAQSGETRSPSMKDVPTLVELGFKDVVIESWYAAFVPTGTPPAIIARLNAEMDKAMADPPTREKLLKTATDPVGGGPDRLARAYSDDAAKYARLVKELGITTK